MTSVTIPDNVTRIDGYAFSGCDSLKKIIVGAGVKSISDTACLNCTKLEEINVSSRNRMYSSVDGILLDKSGTQIIIYPKNNKPSVCTVPDGVTAIGANVFADCTSLISITIPDSVTNIDRYAFNGCSNLREVIMSSSVKTVEQYAFKGCDSFTDVYFTGTETEWYNIMIDTGNDRFESANVHYAGGNAYESGDANGDGFVNLKDSNKLKMIILGKIVPDEKEFVAADLNGDGAVNTKDSFILKKKIANG